MNGSVSLRTTFDLQLNLKIKFHGQNLYNTDYSILLLTDRVARLIIQNGPFGTLSEPELSQKKCSEELRSRSIDWRGQKVPGDQQNYTKGDHVFDPGERFDNGMLLTVKILMILCSARV